MTIRVQTAAFSGEHEARAAIAARGWHAVKTDAPPPAGELHWHDFDAELFVLEGELTLWDAAGVGHRVGPGDRASVPKGTLHREDHAGYCVVFGISIPPDQIVAPLNREPV